MTLADVPFWIESGPLAVRADASCRVLVRGASARFLGCPQNLRRLLTQGFFDFNLRCALRAEGSEEELCRGR